jgi:hypothetical protein
VTSAAAPTKATTRRAARLDAACAEAVELARCAAADADPDGGRNVGEHLGATAEAERLVTHLFECLLPGYRGWRFETTVTRIARSKHVTVCETEILPGPDAILAPTWLPWGDRVQPGDLGVGDLLPAEEDDDRLVPGYVQSDDPAVEEVASELGLGRPRVMSRLGREEAAQRWYDGEHGPGAQIAQAAPVTARCGTCGFYLPVAGSLRAVFGVCGNLFAPDDGVVVSADHGCGAHSDALSGSPTAPANPEPTFYDDASVETIPEPEPTAGPEPVAEAESPSEPR